MVELLVVMSTGSTLLVLAIGLIHQAMTLSAVTQAESDCQFAMQRLTVAFRIDVQRAQRCSVETPERIELVMSDDSVVTYVDETGAVIRNQTAVDQSRSRESYRLLPTTTAMFESLDDSQIAALTVARSTKPTIDTDVDTKRRIQRRIEARIGSMMRYERAGLVMPEGMP